MAEHSLSALQDDLRPYLRPREEAQQIRRVLALHLKSMCEDGPIEGNLTLVEKDCVIKARDGTSGLRRQYLDALEANVVAQKSYEQVKRAEWKADSGSDHDPTRDDALETHVATLKLSKKLNKLGTVERYLIELDERPEASPDFIIVGDDSPLQKLPPNTSPATARGDQGVQHSITAIIDDLEKTVLRAKLLLEKEQRLLAKIKEQQTSQDDTVVETVRRKALHATRDVLVDWIEEELGKGATADAQVTCGDGPIMNTATAQASREQIDIYLEAIKDKYNEYLGHRRKLVDLASATSRPVSMDVPSTETIKESTATTALSTHLLTPYIEHLLNITAEHRATISVKSHINVILAKQMKAACQSLDYVKHESQLLPQHPASAVHRKKEPPVWVSSTPETRSLVSRVQPWTQAAESAKIATLEVIAEKIEDGQLALERSMVCLEEMEHLTGVTTSSISTGHADSDGQGVWCLLDGTLGAIKSHPPRKT